MPRSPLIGLDVGTTKVCTVVAEVANADELEIIGVGNARSTGLRKGVVIDVADTVRAVRESVAEAQQRVGFPLRSVIAGITGNHVSTLNTHAAVPIANERVGVTESDVDRVMEAAREVALSPDREIIHCVPRGFSLDGQEGVRRPLAMFGKQLGVDMHVVTGQRSFIANLVKCIESAGLEVAALVMEPIATGEAIATPAELELGVAIIDIGGGTTDVAVFSEGSIAYSVAVPVAGNHVTHDLSYGLRTPMEGAEKVKTTYATADVESVGNEEMVEVVSPDAKERRLVPRRYVAEIVESRQREILELVNSELISSGLKERLASGAILAGGGSLLPGTRELAQQVLGIPARIGVPLDVRGLTVALTSPIYATGVGLVRYALRHPDSGKPTHPGHAIVQELWQKLRSFVRGR